MINYVLTTIWLFVIQGYYWSDNSELLYKDFSNLAITERRILKSSYSTTRFTGILNLAARSYVSYLKQKLVIVTMFNTSKVNQNNICVVVLLTLITKPAWQNIACDQKIPDNYFICETQGRDVNATTFDRHKHHCHTLYTYVLGKCYWLQNGNDTGIALFSSTEIPKALLSMFSAWSFGHSARNRIQMYIDKKEKTAFIMTHGLPQHFGKTWIIILNNQTITNASSHALRQVTPISYTYIYKTYLHFKCKDSTCVILSHVCDGIFDCPDKSDEDINMCTNSDTQEEDCGDFHLHCVSGGCIHATQQCDDWQHCPDGSDELYCLHSHLDHLKKFHDDYLVQV